MLYVKIISAYNNLCRSRTNSTKRALCTSNRSFGMKCFFILLILSTQQIPSASGPSANGKNFKSTIGTSSDSGAKVTPPSASSSQPFISAFGDQYVAERNPYIEVVFTYGILTDVVTSKTSGKGAQVTGSNSMAVLESGTTETGTAKLETKRAVRYIAGHENYAYFTAMFSGGTSVNSTQWLGLFDDGDGYAVGYNGTTFSILHRNDSNDKTIAQSNFNLDKLDGTGGSGIKLDPTKLNIFKIQFGWLGASTIIFSIVKDDGTWYSFHKIHNPNSETVPHVTTPILPVRAEVAKKAGSVAATNLTLKSASWSAGTVGRPLSINKRNFSTKNVGFSVSDIAEKPMISIQSQAIFKTKTNRNVANIIFFSVRSGAKPTNLRVIKNPTTLTGATFTEIDTNSSIYVDTSATAFSGGTDLFGFSVALNASSTLPLFDPKILVLELLKDDIITVTAFGPEGVAKTDIFIIYEEII
jgi:hypothetical protein